MQAALFTKAFIYNLMSKVQLFGDDAILQLNRNARAPKKPNHGSRPCSSVVRRYKYDS